MAHERDYMPSNKEYKLPIFSHVANERIYGQCVEIYDTVENPYYQITNVVKPFVDDDKFRLIVRSVTQKITDENKFKALHYNGRVHSPVWFVNKAGLEETYKILEDKYNIDLSNISSRPLPVSMKDTLSQDNIRIINDDSASVFYNSNLGELRTVLFDNQFWFVGKDIATILGYTNPTIAIKRHVDPSHRMIIKCKNLSRNQKTMIIDESGAYSFVLSSHHPNAKRFKHWIVSEVIPTLREKGTYSTPIPVPTVTVPEKVEQDNLPTVIENGDADRLASAVEKIEDTIRMLSNKQSRIEEYIDRANMIFASMGLNHQKTLEILESMTSKTTAVKDEEVSKNEHGVSLNSIAREMGWYSEKGVPHYSFTKAVAKACGINTNTICEHDDEYSRCVRYYEDEDNTPRFKLYIKNAGIDLIEKWCIKYKNGKSCRFEEKYQIGGNGHKVGDTKSVYYIVRNMDGNPVDNKRYLLNIF